MNTSSDTPANQSQEDLLQLLLSGVGATSLLEKIDRIKFQPTSGELAAAMLFAFVVARSIAVRMEYGIAKEKMLQKLDRSIADIIAPSAQDRGVSGKAFAPAAATLSLEFQRFTEAVREDFLRMAGQILQINAAQKVRDETSRETADGCRSNGPSASSLASVISYSSSLHECWFW